MNFARYHTKKLRIYALEIPPFRPRRHADRPDAGHHPLGAVRPAALRDRSRGPDDALSLYRTAAAGFVPRILRHDLRPSRRGSEKYGEYFSRQGIFENKLYAGIPELLSALQAQGATLAIATSKPDFLAERIARHFGFRDRFTLICGGTAYGPCSTKAGVIRETLAQLRIDDPSQAVMIGDRRFDIEGAAAAGVESIGVLWGYGSREELEKASPGYLAADIPELRRLLA